MSACWHDGLTSGSVSTSRRRRFVSSDRWRISRIPTGLASALLALCAVMLVTSPVAAARSGHQPHRSAFEEAAALAPDDAATAADGPGCERLQVYTLTVARAMLDAGLTASDLQFFSKFDFETATPSEMRRGARIAEKAHDAFAGIDDTDIPPAARDYHEAMTDLFGVMSQVLTAVADGGLWAALPYADTIDRITGRLEQAKLDGRALCGAAWDDAIG